MREMDISTSSESLALPPGTGIGSSSENEQKKIWFDYIKTLNERRLQSALRSGLTTYLLVAVLAGMAYKFVPLLPAFLKAPGSVRATTTFLLLETDIFCFAAVVLFALAA